MNKKVLAVVIFAILFIALLIWLFKESSKPLPGTKVADLGRGHVPIGEKVDYNSNPPTSGKHYEDWIRAGVYSETKDDGNLVHSLEHGYMVMYYKCDQPAPTTSQVEASGSGKMDQSCEEKKTKLARIYESKGKQKLIVVPRANLDTNFAITAWDYLDKFNDFDEQRIIKFIDVHINQGPEKTME